MSHIDLTRIPDWCIKALLLASLAFLCAFASWASLPVPGLVRIAVCAGVGVLVGMALQGRTER